jgi:hypothetical protein
LAGIFDTKQRGERNGECGVSHRCICIAHLFTSPLDSSEPDSAAYEHSRERELMTRTKKKREHVATLVVAFQAFFPWKKGDPHLWCLIFPFDFFVLFLGGTS